MQVVSAREFRSNQGKFLNAAINGQPVMLKSKYGNFKIIPVFEEENSLTNHIIKGLKEVKMIQEGKSKGYTIDELLDEL